MKRFVSITQTDCLLSLIQSYSILRSGRLFVSRRNEVTNQLILNEKKPRIDSPFRKYSWQLLDLSVRDMAAARGVKSISSAIRYSRDWPANKFRGLS